MSTHIKTWEIVEGRPRPLESTLAAEGRTEAADLEEWIAADPSIVRPGLVLIGRQVATRSGPLDLLAVDGEGNLVILELKRDKLPRDVITQAIDYAADVASWGAEKIGEVCAKYTGESLEDVLAGAFPDTDFDGVSLNSVQRVVLVGFAVEPALERMIEWLSEGYGVGINAVVLKYVRTREGSEVLTRSAVISEQAEAERTKRAKKFTVPMSDEPGAYEEGELRERLLEYLQQDSLTVQRIRGVLLPSCLKNDTVTRDMLKQALVDMGAVDDLSKAGLSLTTLSSQMGMAKNDFLRQAVSYGYPNNAWEKDDYAVRPEARDLVRDVLGELEAQGRRGEQD